MEITPATAEDIATFKRAAAARYQELGVPADVADRLFERQMAKTASELGLVEDKAAACSKHAKRNKPIVGGIPTNKAQERALNKKLRANAMAKKSEVSEKLADVIAHSLGRGRNQA
jgi:hypothetical protein